MTQLLLYDFVQVFLYVVLYFGNPWVQNVYMVLLQYSCILFDEISNDLYDTNKNIVYHGLFKVYSRVILL